MIDGEYTEGLGRTQWRQFIVSFLKKGSLQSSDFGILEKMSPMQKAIFRDYRLSIKYIKDEGKPLEDKYKL